MMPRNQEEIRRQEKRWERQQDVALIITFTLSACLIGIALKDWFV